MSALEKHKCLFIVLGSVLFFSFNILAQTDTTKLLNPVEISPERDSIYLVSPMKSIKSGALIKIQEIERKKPIDLGELTKSLPGVFLKSYGGVGGLKTMNARGLGSQHFLVLINGIPYLQAQSGSANLGNIQTDFVETLKYSNGGTDEYLVPALSKTYSGVVQVFTTDQVFIPNRTKLCVSSSIGSFGHYKTALNTYFSKKNFFVSANAYGFLYKGNYPYTFENGFETIHAKRENNKIGEGAVRLGAGFQTNKHRFQIGANYFNSQKQLPGAIIFYQPANRQDLNLSSGQLNFQHNYFSLRYSNKTSIAWTEQNTGYYDPYFVGKVIDEKYRERNFLISHASKLKLGKKEIYKLVWALDYSYNELVSNATSVFHPQRHRGIVNIGFIANWKKWNVQLDAPLQVLMNKDKQQAKWKEDLIFTPSLGFNRLFYVHKSAWNLHFNIARTARIASFNELFYGKSGTVNLKPEKASMGSLGLRTVFFSKNGFSLQSNANGFFAFINDKIITIPTKNLFVWSVRNVGKVISYGFDASFSLKKTFYHRKIFIEITQKTALTVAKDYSDKTSSSYRQQIPYTPYWNYSGELVISFFGAEISWESNFNGFRFALGENIYANLLNEYWLHQLRASYLLNLTKKKEHALRFYFVVRNIFDKQYQVIRSFPMPGRSFEIGLKYEWIKNK